MEISAWLQEHLLKPQSVKMVHRCIIKCKSKLPYKKKKTGLRHSGKLWKIFLMSDNLKFLLEIVDVVCSKQKTKGTIQLVISTKNSLERSFNKSSGDKATIFYLPCSCSSSDPL